MSQSHYQCQQCGQYTLCALNFCCYKVVCLKCSKSRKHQCQVSLSLLQCNLQYEWCCRCMVKICTQQCEGCRDKKFCNDCFQVIHQNGKFQFHHSILLDNQGSNQICHHHKLKKSIKSSQNFQCIICVNNLKKSYDIYTRKQTPPLQQIQEKFKVHYANLIEQNNTIIQYWQNLKKQVSDEFKNLVFLISSTSHQFINQIEIKKSKNIQEIKDKIQSTKLILNEIKNIHKLINKNDEHLTTFINEKKKLLVSKNSYNYKYYPQQENFNIVAFDQIKNILQELDLNKIIIKEKPKVPKLKKVTSATFLHMQKPINDNKSPKSKRSNKQLFQCTQKNINIKIRKISQNQEDFKNDNSTKKTKNINEQIIFRRLLSPTLHNKQQRKSIKNFSHQKEK